MIRPGMSVSRKMAKIGSTIRTTGGQNAGDGTAPLATVRSRMVAFRYHKGRVLPVIAEFAKFALDRRAYAI